MNTPTPEEIKVIEERYDVEVAQFAKAILTSAKNNNINIAVVGGACEYVAEQLREAIMEQLSEMREAIPDEIAAFEENYNKAHKSDLH